MIDQYLLLFIFYGLSVGASALLYGDTDHAVRMHDIVGELCYRGSLCLVFLHSFDYSVGCSDRLIREYIPDSGILIEYTYIYGKINTDLGSCKCIYEEKRQKFASPFFSLTSLPAATLFRMMVLGFVIQNVEGILKRTR